MFSIFGRSHDFACKHFQLPRNSFQELNLLLFVEVLETILGKPLSKLPQCTKPGLIDKQLENSMCCLHLGIQPPETSREKAVLKLFRLYKQKLTQLSTNLINLELVKYDYIKIRNCSLF